MGGGSDFCRPALGRAGFAGPGLKGGGFQSGLVMGDKRSKGVGFFQFFQELPECGLTFFVFRHHEGAVEEGFGAIE